MYRFAQQDLSNWFESKRRKPLILRGARQVGKSTLVREFCKAFSLDLFEINLEELPLKSLEAPGYIVEDVIREVEYRSKKKIGKAKETVIFFDEIQDQPKAINLLRYFYEKKAEIAVIAAGSLLEVVMRQEEIEFPVGRVDFYQLGPMTFSEFLMALKREEQIEYLQNNLDAIPDFVHQDLLKSLKEFMVVGGMPEAVLTYSESEDFFQVRKVQGQLLETYKNDFLKYASSGKIPKIHQVFNYIPSHLGQKLKYVEISREFKSREIEAAIQVLIDARIIAPVYFSQGKQRPLKATQDDSIYKLYFLDIGLAAKANDLTLEIFDDEKFSIYLKGAFAEQFVFQHMQYAAGRFDESFIAYWINEKKNATAEIDFLVEAHDEIIPIEVKSELSTKLKSLIYFMHLAQHKKAIRFSKNSYQHEKIQTKISDGVHLQKVSFELFSIPLYGVEFFSKILNGH